MRSLKMKASKAANYIPIPPAKKSFNFLILPRVIKHTEKTCVKLFGISNLVCP